MDRLNYHGSRLLGQITTLLAWAGLLFQVYCVFHLNINTQACCFMLLFSGLSVLLLTVRICTDRYLSFTATFLLSTFTMITTWRISALVQVPIVPYVFLLAIIVKISSYIVAAYNDLVEGKLEAYVTDHHHSRFEWQLLFIRLFLGYDLIPHFCEKLFAGPAVRMGDITSFVKLDVPHPVFFVFLSGLIELAGSISISCGFLTRLGSLAIFVYLMVATVLGNHFSLGFIWADAGGGWEFPVLWSVLMVSYCVFGANTFSLDSLLKRQWNLPDWIIWLMGGLNPRKL